MNVLAVRPISDQNGSPLKVFGTIDVAAHQTGAVLQPDGDILFKDIGERSIIPHGDVFTNWIPHDVAWPSIIWDARAGSVAPNSMGDN